MTDAALCFQLFWLVTAVSAVTEGFGPSRPNLTREHDDAHVHQPYTPHRENTGPPTADTGPGTVPHQRPARDGRNEG